MTILSNAQGIEYPAEALMNLLVEHPDAAGLIFRKPTAGFTPEKPFEIEIATLSDEFEFGYQVLGNNHPTVQAIWQSDDTTPVLTRLEGVELLGYETLEFFNDRFELCLFLRDQLEPVLEQSDQIIISGFAMNFGTMAFPYEVSSPNTHIVASDIFTLKAEACSMEGYRARYTDGIIGTPTVVAAIPCPPYWVPGLTNGITNTIYRKLMLKPRRYLKKMDIDFVENKFDEKIRQNWISFAAEQSPSHSLTVNSMQRSGGGLVKRNDLSPGDDAADDRKGKNSNSGKNGKGPRKK